MAIYACEEVESDNVYIDKDDSNHHLMARNIKHAVLTMCDSSDGCNHYILLNPDNCDALALELIDEAKRLRKLYLTRLLTGENYEQEGE